MPDNGWRRRATESSAPSGHHGGLSVILDPPLTSPLHQLSAREIQVLKLMVEGRTSKEIARCWAWFRRASIIYRRRIMAKLGVRHVPALVRLAIRFGLIDL
jgi:DNA-binding CsgD family transcriptional regulator